MHKVYSAIDAITVARLEGLLKQADIKTAVLNQSTGLATGEVPFFLSGPELWIADEADLPRARAIVADFEAALAGEADQTPRPDWTCPTCGETIAGQFTACWNCEIDNDPDPRQDPDATCPTCGYSVHQLPARRCPECGEQF